uniref:Kelch domain-containing protein 3-like isoform X2 n=1 Tax=Geotrypetes seraphini TaxID=260995 RepID=A0A6P8QB94_GEOSA|nr:kelch domain-containing protein 3-like isoform X2 [Geotrypetes seraphini]
MALASGHWIRTEVTGDLPSPRHGHALAVAGNVVFVFGGCATHNNLKDEATYFNDFYMLTVTPADLAWEVIPQEGSIPCPREGHSLCIVKRKIYLFGGSSKQEAEECLPGMYCFDLGNLTWQKLKIHGIAPQTLRHSSAVVGENIFLFGGIHYGTVVADLYIFNTVTCSWIPIKTTGLLPEARSGHTLATVGDQIYLFGGCTEKNIYNTDMHVLDTVTLVWQQCDVKGEIPSGRTHHSFTAHHDKDIYLFGGLCDLENGNTAMKNDVMKLSLAKMKWKVPLYVGIPPACRHGHAAFILHSHLFIFGGVNEEVNFNDIMGMKLINPSDRKPIMKDILSEFGIQGISNGEKANLIQVKIAFQKEKEFYRKQIDEQQQEIQEMLEKHKAQNESWLKARADENDKERKKICKLREELLKDQKKLREEQQSTEKRNQQLISIMQQFKGI